MSLLRALALTTLALVALVLQVSLFPHLAYDGVVPNLVLLLVVAAGLARGPEVAAVLGFVGGMLLDLAPPADGVAGRWALSLVVVGYLAGTMRHHTRTPTFAAVTTVAACSFVGVSIFALSGMLLQDPALPVTEALAVIAISVAYDLLLAPFVIPPVVGLMRRLHRARVAY